MRRTLLVLGTCSLLSACEPVAIALLGAGASTALRYNIDGVAARTFTAPAADGRAANREIELEPITRQATRVRVTARGASMFYDNATAVELVQQTGKILDAAALAKAAPAPTAGAGATMSSN